MNVLFDIISYYRSFDVVMSPKATIFYKSLFINLLKSNSSFLTPGRLTFIL